MGRMRRHDISVFSVVYPGCDGNNSHHRRSPDDPTPSLTPDCRFAIEWIQNPATAAQRAHSRQWTGFQTTFSGIPNPLRFTNNNMTLEGQFPVPEQPLLVSISTQQWTLAVVAFGTCRQTAGAFRRRSADGSVEHGQAHGLQSSGGTLFGFAVDAGSDHGINAHGFLTFLMLLRSSYIVTDIWGASSLRGDLP